MCQKQNKNNLKKWNFSKNKYNKRLIQAEEKNAPINLLPKKVFSSHPLKVNKLQYCLHYTEMFQLIPSERKIQWKGRRVATVPALKITSNILRTRRKKNIYNRGRHQLGILIKNRTYYITTIIIKSRLRILQIIIGLSTIHKKLILKMPSMKKVTTNTLIKMTEPRRCSLQSRQNIKA